MTNLTAASKINETRPIGASRWALLFIAFVTSTVYAMTLLVVSVILPQIQGSLSATPDQIAWTMTFNILATAIMTPISGWLANRFGARNLMMFCMAGFGLSSLACGLATSLEALIIFRILQGGLGAPLVPIPQAVVLAAFPRSQHAMATSIYGMGVVIGPILGPVYGGYLAELYGWRSAFFMIAPIAAAILVGIYFLIPKDTKRITAKFTWFGFLALSTGLTCLQLILDRGQRLDWLDSFEINTEIIIGLIAIGIFFAHSKLSQTPLLDLRHLKNWNYILGLLIVTIYGMLNFTPMVMLPPMLKNLGGYPETIIGTLVSFRGVGAVLGFLIAGWMGKLDPRITLTLGHIIQAWTGWVMWNFNADVAAVDILLVSTIQGICVGIIWVPLTVSTFSRIDPHDFSETSAIYHLLRNIGSSIFISISVTTVIRSQTINYAQLGEFITPLNEAFVKFSTITGINITRDTDVAQLSAMVNEQAQLIGFLNSFGLYTATCLVALPLVLLIRPAKQLNESE